MTPPSKEIYQPLVAAHDFISSRLLYFFNNDDFADTEFAVNEFDVFAIFIATIAFLNNKEPSEEMGTVVEDFHATMMNVIVQRILAAQPEQASVDKEEALADLIKKIFEERFRHYFHIFKKGSDEDVQQMYIKLADAFLDSAVKESGPQETLSRFTSFVIELFDEVSVLLQKTESLAGS
ncbi:MAG: hypothetical protein ABFS09_01560 [Thermodesulfobacteriota bacterium]